MKIAFFGTGDFSRSILEGILEYDNIKVDLVVSQPDKPIGRKKIITPTPVKEFALSKGIRVLQPEKLKDNINFFNELDGYDFIVVVAYGKIVPNEVLVAPKYGCINIHGSILPNYRGASPIQESIKNGDTKTGMTIMYMSEGMDEGDILRIEEVDIDIMDTTIDIFNKFIEKGPKVLVNTLEGIINGNIVGIKQNDLKASYCKKILKEDGLIDFKNEIVMDIYNKYRAYNPWPGIYTFYKGKKFTIEECYFDEENKVFDDDEFSVGDVVELVQGNKTDIGIICKKGILILRQVKLEGKKTTDILSFINGDKGFLDYNFLINV